MTASVSSDVDQQLERLETTVGDICELLVAMNTRFDDLVADHRSSAGEGSNNRNKGPKITQTGSGTSGSTAPNIAKLDFPWYGGDEDPTSWIL
jgi:hypothetical protein